MLAQTLDGQPISAGIGSRQQRAFDTFAQSIDLGATGPGDGLDGEPLQSDVEQALEPYDPFTDAPYNPGQDAYDPISDSPYDDVVATPGLGSNQQQVEQSYVQDLNLGSTGPGPTTTPGLGSAQQRTEQEFAEDQDLGSTGPDYTDDLPTARHRYMALLQYADELDQELLQRQMLNTSAPGASAGVTIRERVPSERVAAMSGVDLNRLNAEIEARLLQHRSFFMDPDQTDAPTELSENVLKRDAPDESEVDDGARKRAKALTAADRATERARIRRAVTQRVQAKADQFPISVKPGIAKTRRNDRKGFFRLAMKDSAAATPGLGSARQQAQADFVSSVNVGATGPQQLQRKERGELGVQPVVVKPKPSSRRPRLPPRRRNDEYRRMPVDLPPYVARPPNGFVVTEVPSADTDDADSQIRRLVDMDPGEDPGDPGDLGEDTGDDGEEPYDPVTDAPYNEDDDGYVTADDQLDDSTFDSLMDYYYDTTEPTDSNELPDGEQGLVDDVAEMAEDDEQAVDSGATNDGVGGPHVATDVDVAGNPIVQAIGAASIPTNRAPGGSRTQFGIQSYGVVRAAAPGPMNTEIRQGLIEQRKLAQASYVNTALAPVEDYAYAYQAPMPGYTPYYYGVYA